MPILIKCKMCGGDIEATSDMTVGQCRYCGSTMTLPRIESDKKARLFNRANEYRMNNEFDKAYDAYKTITEEDEQESEAYWGMILSEYGVEYVEDPASHKRIPTCHRTQVQSIRSSTNYQLALKYADGERKLMYQEEAEALDKLQRTILSVSSKEEPYDVFICYKETDDFTGERTLDSVLAQDIYRELEKNGIRTFFSRISLEKHLGENYEPYIYAALKSARVMLHVTKSSDHSDAVWVKNEWSRFLHFMEEDDSKVLIPVYQDISPYELPEELSKFQAQDMGKVGAIQDLVYGVQKVLGSTQTEKRNATLEALLADKQEREEKERRKKKTIKLALFIAAAIVMVVGAAFGVRRLSKMVQEKRESKEASIKKSERDQSLEESRSIKESSYAEEASREAEEKRLHDEKLAPFIELEMCEEYVHYVDAESIILFPNKPEMNFEEGIQKLYDISRDEETFEKLNEEELYEAADCISSWFKPLLNINSDFERKEIVEKVRTIGLINENRLKMLAAALDFYYNGFIPHCKDITSEKGQTISKKFEFLYNGLEGLSFKERDKIPETATWIYELYAPYIDTAAERLEALRKEGY